MKKGLIKPTMEDYIMTRNLLLIILLLGILGIALTFSACGGETPKQESPEPAKETQSAQKADECLMLLCSSDFCL
jgi:hypothetical protein